MENLLNDDEVVEEVKEYRWETGYEKTWEAIKEDDDGIIDGNIAELIRKAKRRRQNEKALPNRLGMMRHLSVILDCSESMKVSDLKPTRWACTLKLLATFIEEFFIQNPISQLGLILLRNKRGEKATDLTGTSRSHIKALKQLANQNLVGEPSIQNGLESAYNMLKMIPTHASREILLIMSSLSTCDPGDITTTIENLKSDNIRCSVITLSAEMRICRLLTTKTNGRFGAVLDDAHFRDLLMEHVDPPPTAVNHRNAIITMGFPYDNKSDDDQQLPLSMCMCHMENSEEPSKLTTGGYYCPQCYSKYCELPVECLICSLTLVSAPHLARSYHHLFPVQHFIELNFNEQAENCYACKKIFEKTTDQHIYRCEYCEQFYCLHCDNLIHETLHSCIGCNTIPNAAAMLTVRQSKPKAPTSSTLYSKQKSTLDSNKSELSLSHNLEGNYDVNGGPIKLSNINLMHSASMVMPSLNSNSNGLSK